MKIREIKVREFTDSPRKNAKFRTRPTPKPQLVLTGLWLMEAGIFAGDTVSIEVHENRLVISA